MSWLKKIFGKGTTYLTEQQMDEISKHVEVHVGEFDGVMHEIVSDALHIDIIHVPVVRGLNCQALCTMGMSALPMPGLPPELAHAEVLILLPPEWPTKHEDYHDEANYWPIRWLKTFARLPVTNRAGLTPGITVPCDLPGTRFDCLMLCPAEVLPPEFSALVSGGRTVNFYALMPLTELETAWKIHQESATALWDRFQREGADLIRLFIVERDRPDFIIG